MSLFGKVLACFNIIGAVALFALAAMDYGKRQAWSYSVFRHELVLRGLPLDEKEEDRQGRPVLARLDPDNSPTLASMFSGLGTPVRTQAQEVKRVRGVVDARVEAAGTNLQGPEALRARTYLLARALLPLTDSYLEREELLTCQFYLASKATLDNWRRRYVEALDLALAQMGPKRSFEETFHHSVRTLGGEPSVAFTTILLGLLPPRGEDVKKKVDDRSLQFDTLFVKALEAEHQQLKTRLAARFSRAELGTEVSRGQEGQATAAQKLAIARLLFALAPFLAEEGAGDQLKGLDPASPVYADKVLTTEPYKQAIRRAYVVCGLRTILSAIGEEGAKERKLANAVVVSQRQEQLTFVLDNLWQIETLRDWAGTLDVEKARIEDNKRKLGEQAVLVKKRQLDVERLEMELKESRALTADAVTELRKLSEDVRAKRVELRDAIRRNEEDEKKIRDLEALIRARERK